MKIAKKVGIAVAVLIGIFLMYVAMQPSDYLVARETVIQAKPEQIFPYVNNSQKTGEWMGWQEVDPAVVMNHSGPEAGVGAKSNWESTGKMGVGGAEIVESVPYQLVKTQIHYVKPMQMHQIAEISLTPTAEGTKVRWSVTGKNSFLGRVFCSLINMDKMVGGQFETGLAKLKSLVESSSH